MANREEVPHRIRVKLYPNYMPNVEGAYIARINNEVTLGIEQICAAIKNKGGFTGNHDDLAGYIRQFLDEAAFHLCDGYAVNMNYFLVHPNVGGTFNSEKEAHDHKKHPITFRVRNRTALRSLAKHITIEIEGIAEANGYIAEFIDTDENAANSVFIPGNQFIITGHLIKAAGDAPGVGVYFVPADDPSAAVKVTRIAENSDSKIIGISPDTGYPYNKIEIRTQYAGSGTTLKAPRVITSSFTLEQT
jgi:hypothetical protein